MEREGRTNQQTGAAGCDHAGMTQPLDMFTPTVSTPSGWFPFGFGGVGCVHHLKSGRMFNNLSSFPIKEFDKSMSQLASPRMHCKSASFGFCHLLVKWARPWRS